MTDEIVPVPTVRFVLLVEEPPRLDRLYPSAAPRIWPTPKPVLKLSMKFRDVAIVQDAKAYVA